MRKQALWPSRGRESQARRTGSAKALGRSGRGLLRKSKEEGVARAAQGKGSQAEAEVRSVCWGHITQWSVGHRDDFDFDSQERRGPREGPEGEVT